MRLEPLEQPPIDVPLLDRLGRAVLRQRIREELHRHAVVPQRVIEPVRLTPRQIAQFRQFRSCLRSAVTAMEARVSLLLCTISSKSTRACIVFILMSAGINTSSTLSVKSITCMI